MFQRRTIIEAFNVIKFSTHNEIQNFALTYELEEIAGGTSLADRTRKIVQYLIDRDTDKKLVVEIMTDIINQILEQHKRDLEYRFEEQTFEEKYPKLYLSLRQDGFTIVDYKLMRSMPESADPTVYHDEVFTLLDKHAFVDCRGHLSQALNSHSLGDWAAANAQLRAFIEGLFDGMALRIFGEAAKGKSSTSRRDLLGTSRPPLLDPALNEIGHEGKNFSNGLMKRLHPQGAHPGLSSEEDCTFRLHLVILAASYYLRKFDVGITP